MTKSNIYKQTNLTLPYSLQVNIEGIEIPNDKEFFELRSTMAGFQGGDIHCLQGYSIVGIKGYNSAQATATIELVISLNGQKIPASK